MEELCVPQHTDRVQCSFLASTTFQIVPVWVVYLIIETWSASYPPNGARTHLSFIIKALAMDSAPRSPIPL